MLSVVLPTRNEEAIIGQTLLRLLTQQGEFEVIVSDGGSSDATLSIARSFDAVRIVRAPAGRGAAMNAGAAAASGGMLLFFHADSELPAGAIEALNRIEREGTIVAGGFRHRFDGGGFLLRVVSAVHNLRARATRVFYGDQGLFISRDLFEAAGGFINQFMEDIELGRRLKQVCKPVQLPLTLTTSARRFRQIGILRAIVDVLTIIFAYKFLGIRLKLRSFNSSIRERKSETVELRSNALTREEETLQGEHHKPFKIAKPSGSSGVDYFDWKSG